MVYVSNNVGFGLCSVECCFILSMRFFFRLVLGDVIGRGEFGVVYKATVCTGSLNAIVAVKTQKGIFLFHFYCCFRVLNHLLLSNNYPYVLS